MPANPTTGAGALTHIDRTEAQDTAVTVAGAAAAKKGRDIRVLDLGELLGIVDFFVLVSAGSERQLGTIAEEVEYAVKQAGRRPVRREGTKESGWMLIDFGDVVVHAFTEEQRSYYGLERLWADAPEMAVDEVVGAG